MNTEELRIGNRINLVIIDKIYVYKITKDNFHEVLDKSSLSYFEPIRLTYEWLIRLNFEVLVKKSYSSGEEKQFNVFKKGPLTFNESQNNWYIGGNYIIDQKIKFVHQLQNLYLH